MKNPIEMGAKSLNICPYDDQLLQFSPIDPLLDSCHKTQLCHPSNLLYKNLNTHCYTGKIVNNCFDNICKTIPEIDRGKKHLNLLSILFTKKLYYLSCGSLLVESLFIYNLQFTILTSNPCRHKNILIFSL